MSRKSKCTPELTATICKYLKRGELTLGEIAAKVGVTPSTLSVWKKTIPAFAEAVEKVRGDHSVRMAREARKSLIKKVQGYTAVEKQLVEVPVDKAGVLPAGGDGDVIGLDAGAGAGSGSGAGCGCGCSRRSGRVPVLGAGLGPGVQMKVKEAKTVEKYYPPDTSAIIFTLTNCDPENWKRTVGMRRAAGAEDGPRSVLDGIATRELVDLLGLGNDAGSGSDGAGDRDGGG